MITESPTAVDAATVTPPSPPASAFISRWLLGLMFGVFLGLGVLDGGGGVIWSDVIDAFDVSKGLFGFASGLGLVVAFPILVFGGRLADRFDKRSLLAVSAACLAVAALGFTAAGGAIALIVLLAARGIGVSLLDLANNALALDYQRDSGRHIMGPLHASYSAGGLFGALVVWLIFAAGGGYRAVYALIAATFLVLTIAALRERRQHAPPSRVHSADVSPLLALRLLRNRELRNLAVICAFCIFGEVLVIQWASIYLRDERGLSATVAVVAISLYGATMFSGRVANGPLTHRLGARRALVLQGMTTLVGGVLIAAGGPVVIAIAGAGIVGLGLAGQIPTALSVAGAANPRTPGAATGAVLMVGYIGLASAPFAAGLVATVASTRAVMVGIAIVGALVVAVASTLPPSER
ncbi:MAG: MFS transporter [Thermomicrobiales bacterium]